MLQYFSSMLMSCWGAAWEVTMGHGGFRQDLGAGWLTALQNDYKCEWKKGDLSWQHGCSVYLCVDNILCSRWWSKLKVVMSILTSWHDQFLFKIVHKAQVTTATLGNSRKQARSVRTESPEVMWSPADWCGDSSTFWSLRELNEKFSRSRCMAWIEDQPW